LLTDFFEKLKTIQYAHLRCIKDEIWFGQADVSIALEHDHRLIFQIRGDWKNKNLSFSTILKWTLMPHHLVLEHLRFGERHPIKLAHFVLEKNDTFKSISPHLCAKDSYTATLGCNHKGIYLNWDIQGPKKNEKIETLFLT
jgi:hypothetical protein